MNRDQVSKILGIALKVGVYALLAVVGMVLFAWLMIPVGGYLVASALSVFAAAAVANALALRIYERAQLAGIGLVWNAAAVRNLTVGLAGGIGAALFVLVPPLAAGAAEFQPAGAGGSHWSSILFVSVVLLFGAAGEEMLFRGYGFQVLVGAMGPYATILPVSLLFALAHGGNMNVTLLGLVNTTLWGIVLGYAFLRSGDLWLPIGLHFGWNWSLPLFGVNLSGFTMNVTGYAMHWKMDPLWSGGAYGPEGGLLTTAALCVLVYGLWKAPVRRQIPFLLRDQWEE